MMAKRDKWGIFMQVLCLGLAFFMLFPILYAVSVSLMEQKAVLASPPHFLPPKVTFDNYVTAFTRTTLPRYMVNSFVVAVICSVSRVLVACMSAFAFSFMEFKGKKLLFFLTLSTMMIPPDVLIVANFTTVSRLRLVNTYMGITMLKDRESAVFGPVMAGVVVALVPTVLLFIVFQKQIVAGMMSGAVKE